MARLLSIVEEVFELSGRCSIIVTPGVPRTGDWRINAGDPLRLRRPDGSETQTVVGGIEFLLPPDFTYIPLPLGPELRKNDVPLGTEIWID